MDKTSKTCPLIQTKRKGAMEGLFKGRCELRIDLSLVHVGHRDDSQQSYHLHRQASPFTCHADDNLTLS